MKKTKWLFGIVIGISAGILLLTLPWLKVNPKEARIEAPVDAAIGMDGKMRIVDQGGSRILFLDSSNKIEYIYKSDETISQIVVNQEGKTYFRTQSEIEQNGYVKKECIYSLDKKGMKKEKVYEIIHSQAMPRPSVFQISGLSTGIKFVVREKERFSHYEVTKTGEIKKIAEIGYEDADLWIYRSIITPDNEKVYYLLHNGKLYGYDLNSKTEQLLYDGAEYKKPEGVPKEITQDKEGNLYFSDLGFRDIGKIQEEQVTFFYHTVNLPRKEFLLQKTYETINAESGQLIGCSNEGVYYLTKEAPVGLGSSELSIKALIGAMGSKICLGICCLLILYYLLKLLKKSFEKAELMVKVIMSLCISMVIMGILLMVIVLPNYKRIMEKELESRTKNVGYLVAKQIPINNLKNLNSISDYRRMDYMIVQEAMKAMFNSQQGLADLYCVLYTVQDEVITVNYTTGEDCGCIYPYDWLFEGSDEQEILNTGIGKIYSGLESFEGGYSFSLTPIMGSDGKPEALVEVGVNTRQFEKNVEQIQKELLISIAVLSMVTAFLVIQIFKLTNYQDKEDE